MILIVQFCDVFSAKRDADTIEAVAILKHPIEYSEHVLRRRVFQHPIILSQLIIGLLHLTVDPFSTRKKEDGRMNKETIDPSRIELGERFGGRDRPGERGFGVVEALEEK